MSIRVLVVDDTVVFRRVISDALSRIPGVEVVGAAANGKLALSRCAALKPDLMTLDIEMPDMTGLDVLDAMRSMNEKPAVVVLSAVTVRGGEMTVKALELGAFDFLTKPVGGTPTENLALLEEHLTPIVRAFEKQREIRTLCSAPRLAVRSSESMSQRVRPVDKSPLPARVGPPFILIGVSTGGPGALAKFLPGLPGDLGVPVFVVQHMPALFTKPLAASLSKKCSLRVKEAVDGERAEPNCIYIAPGARQMKLTSGAKREIIIRITDDPPECGCRPAADYLFRSAALTFPGRAIAAILTGMGNDGTTGLRLLKRCGCISFAQDAASCVVFGMPKEAIAAGVIDEIVPLDEMARAVTRAVREVSA